MAFHVGQLVVCVDDAASTELGQTFYRLQRGAVYTVKSVHPLSDFPNLRGPGEFLVRLVELQRLNDWPYGSHRFRPVTTRNQEIIASLLQPLPQKVDA